MYHVSDKEVRIITIRYHLFPFIGPSTVWTRYRLQEMALRRIRNKCNYTVPSINEISID